MDRIPGTVSVISTTHNGRRVRAYSYDPAWLRLDQTDPILKKVARIPASDQWLYRVERLFVSSKYSSHPKDITVIYKRRMTVVVKLKAANNRGYTRVAAHNEVPMADELKRTIVLKDGTTTDNTGWKKLERGADIYWTKRVDGNMHMLDNFAAMSARIPGSYEDAPRDEKTVWVMPMPKNSTREAQKAAARAMNARAEGLWDSSRRFPVQGSRLPSMGSRPRIPDLPNRAQSKKPVVAPKKSNSMSAVLSRQAKKLTKRGD